MTALLLGRRVVVHPPTQEWKGIFRHVGLRLHCPDVKDAVHVVVVGPDVGWALWLGTASANPQAREPAAISASSRFPQRGARHGARHAVLVPTFQFAGRLFSWFRVFQQGNIQTYLLYIFIALIALLLWR